MKKRAVVTSIFIGASALIMMAAFVSIFVGGLKPQLVVPVAGIAVAASVFAFASRFNAVNKDQSVSTAIEISSSISAARTPAITFLRFLMIATLCVGALMIMTFVVEGWTGTLNPDDIRRFVPKAVFAVALAGYIFHKTRIKPQP